MEKHNTSQIEKKKKAETDMVQKTGDLQGGNNLPLAQDAADDHKEFQKYQVFILKTRLHFSMLAKLFINKSLHVTLDLLENFQGKGKLNHLSPACGTQRS